MSWRTITIGDLVKSGLADIQTGPFGTQLRASDYVEEGTPVINVRNIGFGGVKIEKLEFVSEETSERLASHILEQNDIVFGRKGAVDRHLFVGEPQEHWMQGSDCIRLRFSTDDVVPRFASYAFLSPIHQQWMLNQAGNKATMASLNHDVIKRITLRLPPPDVQKRIVDLVSQYDGMIENNCRRIALLEDAARQLYCEWFVRLRFPGHEHSVIIDGVPQGWNRGCVKDFYDTSSGGTPSRKVQEHFYGDIPWVKTQELSNGFITDTDEHISEGAIKNSSAKIFPARTVLIAMYGATVGELGILAMPAATNQACCAVFPKDEAAHFIHAFLFFRQNKQRIAGLSAGAAQRNISQQIIRDYEMLFPSKSLLTAFVETLAPPFDLCLNLQSQNSKLVAARDLLLPRLMSGEIAV